MGKARGWSESWKMRRFVAQLERLTRTFMTRAGAGFLIWTRVSLAVESPTPAPCSSFVDSVAGLVKMYLDLGLAVTAMHCVVGQRAKDASVVVSYVSMRLHRLVRRGRLDRWGAIRHPRDLDRQP